ncbi:conserved hypothetical protein [uncultured Desulfobacterium sp.]|uniref:Phosphatidic acid phosphatase type 2/haloperoxidase domain-containing protein n=1 Tax=uncultured Desulfobacterium sp. TaxID=201089 RepID=A0A445MVQ6_9BACT|nr:conserved hypothetical protein [uncultured Desulfobacterium sp.]
MHKGYSIPFICLFLLITSGCGTLNNGRGWGQDVLRPITLEGVGSAARNAFFDLQTLIPAAGALVFGIDDWDEKTSNWASEHNPVFGSIDDAEDSSNSLENVLLAETVITTFATPSGDDFGQWTISKLKGLGVELAAVGAATGTTELIKKRVNRWRPDGSDNESFPSGHATSAFSLSTLSNRNLDSIEMPKKLRRTFQVGNLLIATGVGWARIEGKKHYPSDVLAGAALAHFFTAFVHDAFLGLPEDDRFHFIIFPQSGGAAAQVSMVF